MNAKLLIRSVARGLGVELTRYHPATSDDARLIKMLHLHEVNVVLDVGANTGQFGRLLRAAGYRRRIVSFEPLSSAREALAKVCQSDQQWDIAPQAAIGDADGEVEIHISSNSVSSSVLAMLNAHTQAAPQSAYVGSEKVPLRRLDDIGASYLPEGSMIFLKVDTQGYEDRVLRGATQTIDRAVGLQLEMSFISLYDGQRHFDEMYADLRRKGFDLWSMSPAFVDPQSGRLLQIDATFFRS